MIRPAVIALTAMLWTFTATASPALLGVEPGVTTVGELRKMHTEAEMIARETPEFGGPIYRVDGESTGAEDVVEARYIFNRNGVPVALTGVFHERKFEHINLVLGTKYRLMQHSTRPLASHGQQRYAWYAAGDVLISLTQPEGSPHIYLTYADQRTRNVINGSERPDSKEDTNSVWNLL